MGCSAGSSLSGPPQGLWFLQRAVLPEEDLGSVVSMCQNVLKPGNILHSLFELLS